MTKKKVATKLTGHAKQLPGKDTDTGLIKKELDKAHLFTKPAPTIDKVKPQTGKIT